MTYKLQMLIDKDNILKKTIEILWKNYFEIEILIGHKIWEKLSIYMIEKIHTAYVSELRLIFLNFSENYFLCKTYNFLGQIWRGESERRTRSVRRSDLGRKQR